MELAAMVGRSHEASTLPNADSAWPAAEKLANLTAGPKILWRIVAAHHKRNLPEDRLVYQKSIKIV